jgi:hypothetical protein
LQALHGGAGRRGDKPTHAIVYEQLVGACIRDEACIRACIRDEEICVRIAVHVQCDSSV